MRSVQSVQVGFQTVAVKLILLKKENIKSFRKIEMSSLPTSKRMQRKTVSLQKLGWVDSISLRAVSLWIFDWVATQRSFLVNRKSTTLSKSMSISWMQICLQLPIWNDFSFQMNGNNFRPKITKLIWKWKKKGSKGELVLQCDCRPVFVMKALGKLCSTWEKMIKNSQSSLPN